jgi:hypothetical protein
MLINGFQFALEICGNDGRLVGQRRVDPSWEAACECARFSGWRKAGGSSTAYGADTLIEPVAQQLKGLPFASGFRVTLVAAGGQLGGSDFPITYPGFAAQARAISSEMVNAGLLAEGETFRYQLLAFPRERGNGNHATPPLFKVEDVIRAPRAKPASIAALTAASAQFGEHTEGDVPVFIPQQVLEEASDLTEQAGRVETGGILVGHLCFDESLRYTCVHVTAQIPARHAKGEAGKLTFTGETWAAVQAALVLRRSDEVMLGWWHSHPAFGWCEKNADCPEERRRRCALMQGFFSADDVCLHETVFPAAYNVALVVTNTNNTREGLQHALFGWRQGAVCRRGFNVLNASRQWGPEGAAIEGGNSNATPCK